MNMTIPNIFTFHVNKYMLKTPNKIEWMGVVWSSIKMW